jgi:hypothetical protein
MKVNIAILLAVLFLALGGLAPEGGIEVRPNVGSETEQETPASNEREVASRPKPSRTFRWQQARSKFSLKLGAERGSGSGGFRSAGSQYLFSPSPVFERDLYTLQQVYRL